jgi:hypothetical protein
MAERMALIGHGQAKTWAEFSTVDVGIRVHAMQYTANNKTP